jgi:transcriptional regulator with XRE-family HTH domain
MPKEPIPENAGRALLMTRVADDLRKALKARGVKQKDIAARLGISEAAVSIRLRGDQNLTLASLQELAALAGLSVSVQFKPRPAA